MSQMNNDNTSNLDEVEEITDLQEVKKLASEIIVKNIKTFKELANK